MRILLALFMMAASVVVLFMIVFITLAHPAYADKGSYNCESDNESGHGEKNGACDDLGF
jgi:hypothetical protein